MILGYAIGFYPSLVLGSFVMSFFPHPTIDVPFCVGLSTSCIAITASYLIGFALGGVMGYHIGKCCDGSNLEKLKASIDEVISYKKN